MYRDIGYLNFPSSFVGHSLKALQPRVGRASDFIAQMIGNSLSSSADSAE